MGKDINYKQTSILERQTFVRQTLLSKRSSIPTWVSYSVLYQCASNFSHHTSTWPIQGVLENRRKIGERDKGVNILLQRVWPGFMNRVWYKGQDVGRWQLLFILAAHNTNHLSRADLQAILWSPRNNVTIMQDVFEQSDQNSLSVPHQMDLLG